MGNQQLSVQDLQKQAHDNSVEAGKKLVEAQEKLEKAESLMHEANVRMSNARQFETILKERQNKLDRAFVLLNKQKDGLRRRELLVEQHDLLLDQNRQQY